jgi:hypothetical protein
MVWNIVAVFMIVFYLLLAGLIFFHSIRERGRKWKKGRENDVGAQSLRGRGQDRVRDGR